MNTTEISNPKQVEIPLSQGFVTVVDAEDYASVVGMKWEAAKFRGNRVYAIHRFVDSSGRQKSVFMHRFLMNASSGRRIYHLDGDGLNNSRRSNLRTRPPSTPKQRRIAGRRYMGVHMNIWGTYRAFLGKKYVGSGKTPEAAALLRDQAAIERYGDNAVLNFPESARRTTEISPRKK
jgi:hypothetical protein